jgi:hypothetical protein
LDGREDPRSGSVRPLLYATVSSLPSFIVLSFLLILFDPPNFPNLLSAKKKMSYIFNMLMDHLTAMFGRLSMDATEPPPPPPATGCARRKLFKPLKMDPKCKVRVSKLGRDLMA